MSEIKYKNKALPTEVKIWLQNTLMLCGLFVLMCVAPLAIQAATFTVSSTADSGAGSLRQAILDANGAAGADTISITTAGTVTLVTPLPAITDQVSISTTSGLPDFELNGSGTQGAGNASIGIYLRAGNSSVRGLTINGFGEAGIRMDTDGTGTDNGNTIAGNRIGTNVAGTAAVANINRGILIVGTTGHTIGGATAADRNIISGNSGRGIDINAGGNATINGNYIGTNAAGTGDLGNTSHGIQIVNSSNSIIGGGSAATRNVISGNNASGVTIIGDLGSPASSNIVRGNYIGVNSGGNTALPNNGSGVLIQGSSNIIGGSTSGSGNVISGNLGNGVSINSSEATGNTVAGNSIGTGADGTSLLANAQNGVQISNLANGNAVGGTDVTSGACDLSCNRIANNGNAGTFTAHAGVYVDVTAGAGNQIRRNSIFLNLGIGIDLGPSGATPNDANDTDTGANNLQNKPVITSATDNGAIVGTLASTASTTFVIDFFRNATTDTQAASEGRTFVGSTQVTTDGSGTAAISYTTSAILTAGQFITATATSGALPFAPQSTGDTSEISDAQPVVTAPAQVSIAGNITKNGSPLSSVTVTLSGSSTATTQTDPSGNYSFTGLMTGGSYVITPSLAGNTFSPSNRSYSNLVNNVSDADFTATADGSNPRIIKVVNTFATATQPVTVPITVESQGDEASFTFSLSYDTVILSNPVVACGADAGACTLVFNTNVAGQIGVSVDPETPFAPGTRELISVTFDTAATTAQNTPVNFTDTPAFREVSDSGANPLPASYVNGFVIFTQGLESDVAPRPNGNGAVSATDITQVRRFAVGLDAYSTTANEFQRADAAPIGTLGNGVVAATDVTQARRYQVGLDPAQGVGGPTGPASLAEQAMTDKWRSELFKSDSKANKEALLPRVVRAISQNTSAGQNITVSLEVDTEGDENNYNFSLNYDQSVLTVGPGGVTIGSGATGGNVLANTTTHPGKIGINIDFGSGTIPQGNNRQLVTVNFNVAANAQAGQYPLTFGDTPAARETSNLGGQPLATSYTDGAVNILATTTGNVRVIDKNTSPGQQVTVTLAADTTGNEQNYGFSLSYDTGILSNPIVAIGSGANGGNVLANTTTHPGKIGFSVDFGSGTIPQGNNRPLVTVTFDVSPGAQPGQTPLIFGDTPAFREVSNPSAQVVPTNFINGLVNILAPTSAAVSVSGRVTTDTENGVAKAYVTFTNGRGEVFIARTNSFGYFRFESIQAGETYTVNVEGKSYQFTPEVITVTESITNMNLEVQPR